MSKLDKMKQSEKRITELENIKTANFLKIQSLQMLNKPSSNPTLAKELLALYKENASIEKDLATLYRNKGYSREQLIALISSASCYFKCGELSGNYPLFYKQSELTFKDIYELRNSWSSRDQDEIPALLLKTLKRLNPILLIDDDTMNLRLISDGLEDKGYIVRKESNSKKIYETNAKQISESIIISDYQMPAVNGVDILQKINAEDRKFLEILYTANSTIPQKELRSLLASNPELVVLLNTKDSGTLDKTIKEKFEESEEYQAVTR